MVHGLDELGKCLVGIDAVGDVLGAVLQDELYDLLVDVGVGQERRTGVPAVVGQVVHRSQYGRLLPKMVAQPVIISNRPAVLNCISYLITN